jgi:SSS family solute:Na+ symporter
MIMLADASWMKFWGNPCVPSVLASLGCAVVVTLVTPASKVSREEALEMITRERESQPEPVPVPLGKRATGSAR